MAAARFFFLTFILIVVVRNRSFVNGYKYGDNAKFWDGIRKILSVHNHFFATIKYKTLTLIL